MEITAVREENQKFFEPLMPDYLWREADLVIGAIEDDTACGVLAMTERETTLSVTYIYVAEQFRRRGVGSALLNGLHELARRGGIDVALVQLSSGRETQEIEKCLEANLFEKDDVSNPIYVAALEDVSQKLLKPVSRIPSRLVPLAETTSQMWNALIAGMEKLPNEEGTVPELDVKLRYDQEASFLLVGNGGVKGCILLDKREEDYILSYFCVFADATPKEMMALFSASYRILKQRHGDGTEIYINTLTATTEKMVMAMTEQKAKKVGQAVTWYSLY